MAPPGIVTRFGNAEIIQYPADRNMAFRIVLSDLIGISLSLRINSNGHFPRILIAFLGFQGHPSHPAAAGVAGQSLLPHHLNNYRIHEK